MPNVAEENDWLVFSHAIPQSTQSCLYIRSSFREIATDILRPQSGLPKAMITGTPGTGKSYFLIYLLWRLLEAKHRVLFIYHHMTIYYDGQGAIFRYPIGSFPSDLSFWSSDLWCLFDAKGKEFSDLEGTCYDLCSFVLSTSPRRDLINDFKKPPVPETFYMPLWSESELGQLAIKCYSTLGDAWKERFEVLGGIPRHVLEDTHIAAKAILESACSQCEL